LADATSHSISSESFGKGLVQIFTGDGKGKTSAALGVVLRALGSGLRVCVVVFMKGDYPYSEWKALSKLSNVEVARFGFRTFTDPANVKPEEIEQAKQALATAREAIEKTKSYKPDVVVMDIRLKGGSGIEACQEIISTSPDVKVIMLTSYAEDEMLFSAIRAGAAGYVLKQIGGDDLVRAIEAVGRGEALLDPTVTQRVFQEVRKAAREEEASAFAELTQQEMHVLQLVSEGRTNRQIAEMLYLGEGTVRNYVSSILSKLNVRNRAEAAAYAVEHNLKEHMKLNKH